MALVEGAARCNIKVRDRENTATTTVYWDGGVIDFVAFQAYINSTFLPRFRAVTNGQVVGVEYIRSFEEDDLTLPVEASDVERKLVMSFKVAGGGNAVFAIPSVDNALIVDGTPYANTSSQAIIDLVNGFISTGIADFAALRNYRGDELLELNGPPYKKHYARKAKG